MEWKDSLVWISFYLMSSSDFQSCSVFPPCSNPSLRVAYIDEVEEREGGKNKKVYYSVLVKAVDNLDQVIKVDLVASQALTFFCSSLKEIIIIV